MSARALSRVLLVEDDPADRFIATRVLRRAWSEVELACALDGQEALEALERAPADAPPELILLDLNMPRMTGHEFLDRLNERNGGGRSPAVTVLTSSDHGEDRARAATRACVRDYLVKPLLPEHLERLVLALEA